MNKIPLIFFPLPFLLFLFSFSLNAQEFGGPPPSVRWKQINTDTVRMIFQPGMEQQAQRAVALIHAMARDTTASLGQQLKKIDIVLQNQTTQANGYVSLGPFRSEFYMTPTLDNFDLGSINWGDALATHEYRHVQQFNNFRNGGSKLLYYLFGEEGLLVATGAAVPDWFYEGDAVYNETRFSHQGRGRLPRFLNQYPALWQAGKHYSWMKRRNGSLKDYVPDHYALGYLLVNYGYTKYGNGFWQKVTHDASAFKGLFYPMQKAIRRYTGLAYKDFTKAALDSYRQTPAGKGTGLIAPPVNRTLNGASQLKPNRGDAAGYQNLFSTHTRYVTNDYFPYHAGEDSLVFLRASYRQLPAFYLLHKGKQKRLRIRDIALDHQFSYRNGRIVYAAYRPDARWAWRDYSVLKWYDIQTGQQKTLTKKSKYFTPDISPAGDQLVAVLMDEKGKNAIHILDAANGSLLKELPNTGNYVFTDPKFIDAQQIVSAVRLPDGRMALATMDISSGEMDWLTPKTYNVLGYPQVDAGSVYFTAAYNGNDELYAVSLADKKIFHIASDIQGNYFVNHWKDSVLYSRFTAEGYQLVKRATGNNTFQEVDPLQLQGSEQHFPVAGQRDGLYNFLQTVPQQRFASRRYPATRGLFNFHSWRPYYEDPQFTFSLYGENVLNTLQSEIYYLYNQNEKTSAVGISEVFGGLFPYITLGTQLTFQRQDSVNNQLRSWNQLDSRIGLSVPLNLTSGRTYKFLSFGTNYFLRNEMNTGPNKQSFTTNSFTYLHHFISWSQQLPSARQHIYPRFANTLNLNHRYAISQFRGFQFVANGALYLPGALRTHNLILNGAFQERDTLRALFSNRFAGARGYTDYYFSRMWKFSVNYHFPLLIPDWGVGNILYIQRVRANVFYDRQRVFTDNKQLSADFRSAGAEFYIDTKWWNQYELTFGFRISHLYDDDLRGVRRAGDNFFEFVLPVSIIPR
ncbi:MAG: hypothetical protein GC171_14890 [Terrimonas sp.]|nr:hypothetical protein [Terrimonas sp.]